jgi:CMP-N-acetylneuraminic acid synthetase
MKTLAVIPARLASTRLPRKMLREIGGQPLIARVYEGVRACRKLDDVIIATDSAEILDFCKGQGYAVRMTSEITAVAPNAYTRSPRKSRPMSTSTFKETNLSRGPSTSTHSSN